MLAYAYANPLQLGSWPSCLIMLQSLAPLLTWRQAMKRGDMILVDELNLAEDAVLERLNRCGSG